MDIKSMFDIRANSSPKVISSDGEFFNNFLEFIKSNSKLLERSLIVETKPQQYYYFDVESSNNVVYEGNIGSQFKPIKQVQCIPKLLCSEFGNSVSSHSSLADKLKENYILENVMYKPFMKSVEKNIISGKYFDKSLFENSETITGSNDFNDLLKLVRKLKDKNENNVVVINPGVMYNILDTITKEGYLNEYLLNGSIEKVKIIETLECPNTKIVGVDPTKICLVIGPGLEVKKLNSVIGYDVYQIFSFVNGGDMFDTSIGMEI
jgi:hypothetical protein